VEASRALVGLAWLVAQEHVAGFKRVSAVDVEGVDQKYSQSFALFLYL
jgi:hypothetical protein